MWNKWINESVECLKWYIERNKLKSIVLGLSGGIDSTVSAVICHLATKDNPNCTFIGRSLPIKNEGDDTSIAKKLGQVLCDDFAEVNLYDSYKFFRDSFYKEEEESKSTTISDGNIMARIRMIYLYQLASLYKGMVIDTDNLSEHLLGFYTLHGDVGDYNVGIRYLYKHEIWELAKELTNWVPNAKKFIEESMALDPTDGNVGGTDMDQIAPGMTYADVDYVLDRLSSRSGYRQAIKEYGLDFVAIIEDRVTANAFKDELPIVLRNMVNLGHK